MAPQTEHLFSLYLDADLNRVFTGSLLEVAAAELRLVTDGVDGLSVGEIERLTTGRSRLLRFEASGPVDALAAVIGQLSASAALFRHRDGAMAGGQAGGELLEPVPIVEPLVYGSELVTIQRYKGKTNERLTRAMLNIALACAGINPAGLVSPGDEHVRERVKSGGGPEPLRERDPRASEARHVVLDPMCGRGTTLNWALAYGLDGVGIEVDAGSLEHHGGFLETWAKRHRLPHKTQRFRANNTERRALSFEVAADRQSFKDGRVQRIQTFRADGSDRTLAVKRGSADVVVTDLPYGIQHRGAPVNTPSRNTRSQDTSGRGQDTIDLLREGLPTWRHWLRSGGAVCLAWNLKRADRREVSRALVEAGFSPVVAAGGYSMRHTVDATIDRDVIVARR